MGSRVRAVVCSLLVGPGAAGAAVVTVTTPAELTSAIAAAQPGDEIVLASGTYRLAGASCTAAGTEAQPIVVRSAEPLGAKLELDGVEGFKVSAPHWRFEALDVTGVCADDSTCEHAFHVYGAAHGFVLRDSRVRDFNAQLKVNAAMAGGMMVAPNAGLIEGNDLGDTRGRNTSNPVTKLNIDGGEDWVIRRNVLHDAHKLGGNQTSYAAFYKSGGKRGVMEQNLVVCARDTTGGTRIGLSLGGGGTAPQFCAPAYDASTPCAVEHEGGIIRNNIIASCSDVGIYLNRAAGSQVLYNTLIATAGVDFRFDTTSGEAIGNVLAGVIRTRDAATMTKHDNLESVAAADFAAWYAGPLTGDLTVIGDVAGLLGAGPAHAQVTDDYCARARPASGLTLGAVEHSLGACDTTMPGGDDAGPGGGHGDGGPGATGDGAGGCCQSSPDAGWRFGLGVVVVLGLRGRRAGQGHGRAGARTGRGTGTG